MTETEDEAAVLGAFADAVHTTGQAPEALSLDNRPSNHTGTVAETLKQAGTTLLATTLGRGQSKAPLEGTFGLFKQDLPELRVTGDSPKDHAQGFLEQIVCAWARGRNGKPRKQLGNRSPADYYKSQVPTDEENAEAQWWFTELQRRQEQMRRTREQRADQEKLAFLQDALASLGISDPKNTLAVSLAYYSRGAILAGVSILQAKLLTETAPQGDLGRYLGGIIRNQHDQNEFSLTTEFNLQNRERFQDICLRSLLRQEEELWAEQISSEQMLLRLVDRALLAPCAIDFHFWASRCAGVLSEAGDVAGLYRAATLRIGAAYRVDQQRKRSLCNRLSLALFEAA